MKKLLALLLALTLIFTFAACGDSKSGDGKDSDGDSIGGAGNTYETPLKISINQANNREFVAGYADKIELFNGFCKDELKAWEEFYMQTDYYKDFSADDEDDFYDMIEEMKAEFGDDYKYSYKITEKTELTDEDLEDYIESLEMEAFDCDTEIKRLERFDDEDWSDFAYDLGFGSDIDAAKEYKDILEDVRDAYESAEVEEGYELRVDFIISGSELEEDEVVSEIVYVLKINGKWVPDSATYGFVAFF